MENIKHFVATIKAIPWSETDVSDIESCRKVVAEINRFLFSTRNDIGSVSAFGKEFPYFSEFHRFWRQHYRDVLGITIDDVLCESVADALHQVYIETEGRAFSELYDVCGLQPEEVCRIRLLTGNQDFRGSRGFSYLAKKYKLRPDIFDINNIINAPDVFLSALGMTKLSQGDKRRQFAQKFAMFVQQHGGTPFGLIQKFGGDISSLREAMIHCEGAGYGNKKTDMVLRDMVVQGVWSNVREFEKLDVASDINTIGVALRTGILKTAIPLVSSFLDQFCYQYAYIDEQNALAWRRVWQIWCEKYPTEKLKSPCLLDYFIYNVVGKQFCHDALAIFKCEHGHTFRWHSSLNRTCQICKSQGHNRERATLVGKVRPCNDDKGYIAICETPYVKSGAAPRNMKCCPFKPLCDRHAHKTLQPPKSISIMGRTGWETAYANEGDGGGGLMA